MTTKARTRGSDVGGLIGGVGVALFTISTVFGGSLGRFLGPTSQLACFLIGWAGCAVGSFLVARANLKLWGLWAVLGLIPEIGFLAISLAVWDQERQAPGGGKLADGEPRP